MAKRAGLPARAAGLLAATALSLASLGLAPPAQGEIGLVVTVQVPRPDLYPTRVVTVGQTGIPARITITAYAYGPDAGRTQSLGTVYFSPSCVGLAGKTLQAPCGDDDAGVYALGSGVTGGGACSGKPFETYPPWSFSPLPPKLANYGFYTSVTLAHGEQCSLDFLLTVARSPAKDATPDTAGSQVFATASNYAGVIGTGQLTQADAQDGSVTVNTRNPPSKDQGQPLKSCPSDKLRLVVKGRRIKRAIFKIDGQPVGVDRTPSRRGHRFATTIDTTRLPEGNHRAAVTVVYAGGARRTVKRNFQYCVPPRG